MSQAVTSTSVPPAMEVPSARSSSAPPDRRSSSPIPVDDDDDEMDRLMRSSPIPDSDNEETASETINHGDAVSESQDDVDGNSLQLSGVSRNEQITLRRAAEQLKVHPYQRVILLDFVKVYSYELAFLQLEVFFFAGLRILFSV